MAKETKKEQELRRKIDRDLQYSAEKFNKLHKQIRDDFKFERGEQWDDNDVVELRNAGVKAITINKIRPIIKLMTGLERQSRSDFKAFPEGGEDELTAEIVTRLLKNVAKNSRIHFKHSEQFKNGIIGGMCFLEPYMDYSVDLINGDLRWKKISGRNVYPDPDFEEYDLSDGKFFIKITRGLTKDELHVLFPDKEKDVENLEQGTPGISDKNPSIEGVKTFTPESYPTEKYSNESTESTDIEYEPRYDLIDYYYKELQDRFYTIIEERGVVKEFETEDEANDLIERVGMGRVVSQKVPVVMLAQKVGNTILYNGMSWTYPEWRSYPFIPYLPDYITEELNDTALNIQGVVRSIKDLNEEYNKRRTQELRHLNSSINSGFEVETGQLDRDNLDKLKKWGASPGVVIERKKNSPPIARITPMPLSQGHAQLAAESAQDLKEASGVNPDLLASDSKSQSGRAILFKQRQGLQMVQEMLDNFSETKRLSGRFILSQIPDLFTVESAMRVLGDAFISENFTVPVTAVKDRALTKVEENTRQGNDPMAGVTELEKSVLLQYPQSPKGEIIQDEAGNLETMVDLDTAIMTVNNVLNDVGIGKYDVEIGEIPFSETIRMANFMDLKELAQQGVPIPPQALIEMSMIPQAQKTKILRQLAAMAQASQAQPAQGA